MRAKAESGWYPGNHPPLGYMHQFPKDENGKDRKRGSTIALDPLRVALVRREFELRAAGLSVEAIREQVIKEDLVTPSKVKAYSKNGINCRLQQKFYRGYFVWQGVEYKGKHDLIIPKAILDKVDERLGKRGGRPRPYGADGLFSNWIHCAHPDCGRSIVREPARKKIKATGEVKEFTYYRCTNSRGIHESMRGMYCAEHDLMNQFGNAVAKVTISKTMAERIANALNTIGDEANAVTRNEIAEFQKALDAIDERRDKLFDMFANGAIAEDEYRRQSDRLNQDRKHFTKLLGETQLKINDGWRLSAKLVLELATNAKSVWKKGTPEEKVEYLKKVCWNPIMEGAKLRYDLRKPFAILCEMQENVEWRTLAVELRNSLFDFVA